MWDFLLEMLDKLFDVISLWPDKPTFQDQRNPFLSRLGCVFHVLGILFFVVAVIVLLFHLFGFSG